MSLVPQLLKPLRSEKCVASIYGTIRIAIWVESVTGLSIRTVTVVRIAAAIKKLKWPNLEAHS